jgi:hypothetical protein
MKILRIREIAESHGLKTAFDLITDPDLKLGTTTAYALWNDEAKRVDIKTLSRVAKRFGVSIGDLFEKGVPGTEEANQEEKNGVESEENKIPVLISSLSIQSARGANVIPAFAQSPNVQTRVPRTAYQKAA